MAQHILPTAGTMLGVCTALIGLVKVVEGSKGPSHVDEYGGILAVIFLVSALSSYAAIRSEHRPRFSMTCERAADLCFMIGLVGLAGLSLVFGYELI